MNLGIYSKYTFGNAHPFQTGAVPGVNPVQRDTFGGNLQESFADVPSRVTPTLRRGDTVFAAGAGECNVLGLA